MSGLTIRMMPNRASCMDPKIKTSSTKTDKMPLKSVKILRSNIFTLFNGILSVLVLLVLIFGSIQDALFGIILIVNPLIGIIQEIRAKLTLDRLVLLNAPRVHAIRDGKIIELATKEIVLDDLIELKIGDQIVVDGEVLVSESLEIDESLLSG